jgi:hypothetical protein
VDTYLQKISRTLKRQVKIVSNRNFMLELEPKLGYGGRARIANKARYSNSADVLFFHSASEALHCQSQSHVHPRHNFHGFTAAAAADARAGPALLVCCMFEFSNTETIEKLHKSHRRHCTRKASYFFLVWTPRPRRYQPTRHIRHPRLMLCLPSEALRRLNQTHLLR